MNECEEEKEKRPARRVACGSRAPAAAASDCARAGRGSGACGTPSGPVSAGRPPF